MNSNEYCTPTKAEPQPSTLTTAEIADAWKFTPSSPSRSFTPDHDDFPCSQSSHTRGNKWEFIKYLDDSDALSSPSPDMNDDVERGYQKVRDAMFIFETIY